MATVVVRAVGPLPVHGQDGAPLVAPLFEPTGPRNRFEPLLTGGDEDDDAELHVGEVHGHLHLVRVLLYGGAAGAYHVIADVTGSPVFGVVAQFLPGVRELAYALAAAAALLAFLCVRAWII